MNKVKKIMVLAIILLVIGIVGSIITFNFTEPSSVALAEEVNNTNITAIDIYSNNEKVEIFPTKDKKITVELSGKTNEKEDILTVEEEGDTLFIQTDNQVNKLFSFGSFMDSLTLIVYIPKKLYDSLKVEMDNGSLQVDGINVKNLQAESENGRLAIENVTSENVQVSTSNGKIDISHVEGDISGKTNNGAIFLETQGLDRELELQTDNGSIKVKAEKEPTNAIFDVKVDNGSIKIFGDSDWDTVIGNGDNIIKLTTSNGSIRVEK